MHIIVIAVGTAGDVHPLLGLSRTFAEHGHKVSFCTSPVFAEMVERCGFRCLPLGTVAEYQATVNDPELWKAKTSLKVLWAGVAKTIRPMFEMLCAEVDSNTIIAGHPWSFGARIFQEKYGTPLITLQVSPSTFLSAKRPPIHKQLNIPMFLPYQVRAALLWALERGMLDRVCAPDVNRIRAELGLPPVQRIMSRWMYSPQGVLGLFPDWFAPPQSDWPAGVRLTGFPLFDEAALRKSDAEVEDFLERGDPPVVFTPGSTLVDESAYHAAASEALDALGCRGIILGAKGARAQRSQPNLLIRSFVPLSKLLPRARALVHHGGIGTVSQAFAAGIPQLVTPFAHDQFDNAARVERLGCGIRLQDSAGFRTLRPALRCLLEDQSLQDRCTATRSRMAPGEMARRNALVALDAIAAKVLRPDNSAVTWAQQPRLTNA
jgi:rhamnosyltransferase subunit B